MKIKMFQGSYLGSYLQFLTSTGGKALFKEVLPGYILIVALILFFVYMENLSLRVSIYIVVALLALPIFAIFFNLFLFSSRAYAASKRCVEIDFGIITIMDVNGHFKRDFSRMTIRHFEGSYIEFINIENIFNSYALFGDNELLGRVIVCLNENGFSVIQYPTQKK